MARYTSNGLARQKWLEVKAAHVRSVQEEVEIKFVNDFTAGAYRLFLDSHGTVVHFYVGNFLRSAGGGPCSWFRRMSMLNSSGVISVMFDRLEAFSAHG
jgi:hypothetical protein